MNPSATPIELVYLTAPACRLCDHGRGVLAELVLDRPFRIREVDLLEQEGQQLLAAARVPFPPAVFADGRLLAHGRLSARALVRQLDELAEHAGPASAAKRPMES